MIPKRNQAGQWRLILDLSSPNGNSVNDGIPKDKFSVQYMKAELFPIAIAANLWGHYWSSRQVEFLSDNKSVVDYYYYYKFI